MSIVTRDDYDRALPGPTGALVRVEWTPENLKAQTQLEGELRKVVVEYYKSQMVDGHHFYTLREGAKPALSKEGALNLTSLFKVTPEFDQPSVVYDGAHMTVTYRCRLLTRDGRIASMGDGLCTTREEKYAYRKASRKCPRCGVEAIARRRPPKVGWICVGNERGGCWAQYDIDDPAIQNQPVGRVPNEDIADQYNTVLKMAQKRAMVAAALHLPLVSELFTQDLEEKAQAQETPGEPIGGATSEAQVPTKTERTPAQRLGENVKALGFGSAEQDVEALRSLSERVTGKRASKDYAAADYARMIHVTSLMLDGAGLEDALAKLQTHMPTPEPSA